jgi:hypothetical protein
MPAGSEVWLLIPRLVLLKWTGGEILMMAMRKSVRKAKSASEGPLGASDSLHNLSIIFFHSHAPKRPTFRGSRWINAMSQ